MVDALRGFVTGAVLTTDLLGVDLGVLAGVTLALLLIESRLYPCMAQ
jgi:hypothetical protein